MIYFFSVNRVSQRDYIRYGLEELVDLGYDVSIVDVSEIMWAVKDSIPLTNCPSDIIVCNDIENFRSVVNKISSSDIILCGGVLSAKLHMLLKRVGCKVGLQALGVLPVIPSTPTKRVTDKIKTLLTDRKGAKKAIEIISKVIIYKFFPYDYVQSAGDQAVVSYPGIGKNTTILDCQSYDIYTMLYSNLLSENKLHDGRPYLLWLDQAIPYHSDTTKFGKSIRHYSSDYYERVKSFLKYLSKRYSIDIVVSLHPRMLDEKEYIDVWDGWNVCVNESTQYISGASLCLTHTSSCLHTVVYHNKPFVVVRDKILSEHGFDNGITLAIKDALNCNYIHDMEYAVNNEEDVLFTIDEVKYHQYLNKYVTNIVAHEAINVHALVNYIKSIDV